MLDRAINRKLKFRIAILYPVRFLPSMEKCLEKNTEFNIKFMHATNAGGKLYISRRVMDMIWWILGALAVVLIITALILA